MTPLHTQTISERTGSGWVSSQPSLATTDRMATGSPRHVPRCDRCDQWPARALLDPLPHDALSSINVDHISRDPMGVGCRQGDHRRCYIPGLRESTVTIFAQRDRLHGLVIRDLAKSRSILEACTQGVPGDDLPSKLRGQLSDVSLRSRSGIRLGPVSTCICECMSACSMACSLGAKTRHSDSPQPKP